MPIGGGGGGGGLIPIVEDGDGVTHLAATAYAQCVNKKTMIDWMCSVPASAPILEHGLGVLTDFEIVESRKVEVAVNWLSESLYGPDQFSVTSVTTCDGFEIEAGVTYNPASPYYGLGTSADGSLISLPEWPEQRYLRAVYRSADDGTAWLWARMLPDREFVLGDLAGKDCSWYPFVFQSSREVATLLVLKMLQVWSEEDGQTCPASFLQARWPHLGPDWPETEVGMAWSNHDGVMQILDWGLPFPTPASPEYEVRRLLSGQFFQVPCCGGGEGESVALSMKGAIDDLIDLLKVEPSGDIPERNIAQLVRRIGDAAEVLGSLGVTADFERDGLSFSSDATLDDIDGED